VKKNENQVGTSVARMPSANAAVKMDRLRLLVEIVEMMRMKEMATEEKRTVVVPPSTGDGMEASTAANLEKFP
jgi:hypothetical protein